MSEDKKSLSKHNKSKTVQVRKEEDDEDEEDFSFVRLMSQFEYYREIEEAKLEFRRKYFN